MELSDLKDASLGEVDLELRKRDLVLKNHDVSALRSRRPWYRQGHTIAIGVLGVLGSLSSCVVGWRNDFFEKEKLEREVQALEERQDRAGARLTYLHAIIDGLEGDEQDLAGVVSGLEEERKEHQAKADEAGRSANEAAVEFEKVANQLATVNAELIVSTQQHEALQRKLEKGRQDLDELQKEIEAARRPRP